MVSEIERVLDALNRANVRYLIVGGVAVVLHGHLRTTADLDLVIELEGDNVRRAIESLQDLGYSPRVPVPAERFADPVQRAAWVRDKGMQVFSLWREDTALTVDLFVDEPFDFAEVYARASRVTLDEVESRVVPLDVLISMKRRADRPEDHRDIEALEALTEEEDQ